MRSTFWTYYPITDSDRAAVSSQALVVLDANALLHAYRLAPGTSVAWLTLLGELQNRLWLPHHAALEYQQNRLSVVVSQHSLLAKIQGEADSALQALEESFVAQRKNIDRSRVVEWVEIEAALGAARTVFADAVAAAEERTVDIAEAQAATDSIHVMISDMYEARVGPAMSEGDLEKLFQEGKKRYAEEIPPGWKDDSKKPDKRRYGDLIIWKQLIEKAKTDQRPVVFITEDVKPDWWRIEGGRTVSPDPRLLAEFSDAVGQPFWMYTVSQFLSHAEMFGGSAVAGEAVSDAVALEASRVESALVVSADDARKRRLKVLVEALEAVGAPVSGLDDSTREDVVRLLASELEREMLAD